MPNKVVKTTLASQVSSGGTFTINYPSGTTRGDYLKGKNHVMNANGATFNAPKDFTVTLNASNITITYNGTTPLAANLPVSVGLDLGGEDYGSRILRRALVGVVTTMAVRMVDLGSPIATVATNLRAAAAVGAGGLLTLLINKLDVPRNIIITSAGNDSGRTFTVNSKDVYGVPMREAITGANAGVAAGVKAHYSDITISVDAACAGNVSIGVGNVLGLPIYLPITAQVIGEYVDNANATAGTKVAGLAVATKPTATNADVRGTVVPNSAPDGSKGYQLAVILEDPDFLGNPQFAG